MPRLPHGPEDAGVPCNEISLFDHLDHCVVFHGHAVRPMEVLTIGGTSYQPRQK